MDRWTRGETNWQIDGQTDGRIHRQIERWTDGDIGRRERLEWVIQIICTYTGSSPQKARRCRDRVADRRTERWMSDTETQIDTDSITQKDRPAESRAKTDRQADKNRHSDRGHTQDIAGPLVIGGREVDESLPFVIGQTCHPPPIMDAAWWLHKDLAP